MNLFVKLFVLAFLTGGICIASVGAWQYWASDAVPAPTVPARPVPGIESPQVPPIAVAKPVENPSATTTPKSSSFPPLVFPSVPVQPKKQPPTGTNHEPASTLFAKMAQEMHREAFSQFINQPGMGVRRMEPTLRMVPREWKTPEWTSEELAKESAPPRGAKDLTTIHQESVAGFVDSNMKSPMERLSLKPATRTPKTALWEIKALDLVGLVVHEAPTVYVSATLPDMKKLKNARTRQLDLFETEGLEQLYEGKDLYIRSKEGTMSVLGPIHAGKACLDCHQDTKEGDLLGAFSYTLRLADYRIDQGNGQPFPNSPMSNPKLPVRP